MADSNVIVPSDWLEHSLFINPNSYGIEGYSLIPWFLLFFKRVSVYAPCSQPINDAVAHGGFSLLEWREAIAEKLITPTFFPSFRDLANRSKLYPVFMAASDSFDRDVVDGNSDLGLAARDLDPGYREHQSSVSAFETMLTLPEQADAIGRRFHYSIDQLPLRYQLINAGKAPLPKPVSDACRVKDLLMPTLVLYDLFNEKHAMHKTEVGFHFTDPAEALLLQDLHGFMQVPQLVRRLAVSGDPARHFVSPRQQLREITAVLAALQPARQAPLSLAFVKDFRAKHGQQFLLDMGTLLHETALELDAVKRLSVIKDKVRAIMKRYAWHFGFSHLAANPAGLLKILRLADLAGFSDAIEDTIKGPPDSFRRSVWNQLHRSVTPTGRWAYALIHGQ